MVHGSQHQIGFLKFVGLNLIVWLYSLASIESRDKGRVYVFWFWLSAWSIVRSSVVNFV